MVAKNTETLRNMNSSTAKHAKWYVRILDPKIIEYKFSSRGQIVDAKKFQCVLVSQDPTQYMFGVVNWDFKQTDASDKAMAKFKKETVWEITTPAFDAKAKSEYNGCSIKNVVLLSTPTKMKAIPPTNKDELNHPAHGIQVALNIKGVMTLLSSRNFQTSGSAKVPAKTFDFVGKLTALSTQRSAVKAGANNKVADAEFVDETGAKIVASVWNDAYDLLNTITIGSGVVVLGSNAVKDIADVKLNIWPSAHVSTDGEQAQALTSLDVENLETTTLTATFTPGQDLGELVAGEAHPTCCKALADAIGQSDAKVFQINRAFIDPPLQVELMVTKDGRLFIASCFARDRTGLVDVSVTRDAMPDLYDCTNEDQVRQQLESQTLTSCKSRMNMRGVIREENGSTKKYIVKVEKTPLDAEVSLQAMRQCLGLSNISEGGVMPSGVDRILHDDLVGLSVKRDGADPLHAYRVLLLVRGTEDTDLDPINETNTAFKLISKNVTCLLSDSPTTVQLVAYSDLKKSLLYRLDKEAALVLVSAVENYKPVSDSSDSNEKTSLIATVEHMEKLSKDQVEILEKTMTLEWKSVLTTENETEISSGPKRVSSRDQQYWSQQIRKLRRLTSEPTWNPETNS